MICDLCHAMGKETPGQRHKFQFGKVQGWVDLCEEHKADLIPLVNIARRPRVTVS